MYIIKPLLILSLVYIFIISLPLILAFVLVLGLCSIDDSEWGKVSIKSKEMQTILIKLRKLFGRRNGT